MMKPGLKKEEMRRRKEDFFFNMFSFSSVIIVPFLTSFKLKVMTTLSFKLHNLRWNFQIIEIKRYSSFLEVLV